MVGLTLSGQVLGAIYDVTASTAVEARARGDEIGVEQTVEFPPDLIGRADIRAQVVGRVASVRERKDGRFRVAIHFPVETTGGELTQLLNVLFGNSSIKPGIRLVGLEVSGAGLAGLSPPRFGRAGLRQLLSVSTRPLLCSALKPMGLSPRELSDLAFQLALGGVDLIKDDHGLADQVFCPFSERVERCAQAVARANEQTGEHCLYVANITGAADQILARARLARRVGAGGVMIAPGLTGFDAMRMVAGDDAVSLPVVFHPAMLGTYTLHPDAGISHGVLYGQVCRLAGADATIFPHSGGRFSFSHQDCRDLVDGTEQPMGDLPPIFPVPAGGMSLERTGELIAFYGREVILLIGGDLHRHGTDLARTCRRFRERMERA